jgi:hypothetical protein
MLGVGGNPEVSGGVVSNSLVLAGNLHLHYDENLRQSILANGYALACWQSLVNRNGTWELETN